MANVIFKRHVRFGKINYAPAKRSVVVDDKYLGTKLMKYLLEAGDAVIPSAAPASKEDSQPSKAEASKKAVK